MKITVAGVGYVGLSLAVLLAQNHEVTAITTTPAKAEKLNKFISPIQDDEIERFFAEARNGERTLNLHTTTDKAAAYGSAELVIIATPTDYDPQQNRFNTCSVEASVAQVRAVNAAVPVVIKSTVPVGFTQSLGRQYATDNIMYSPEFLRESRALYDFTLSFNPALILAYHTQGEVIYWGYEGLEPPCCLHLQRFIDFTDTYSDKWHTINIFCR